jgi:hypothetical protein
LPCLPRARVPSASRKVRVDASGLPVKATSVFDASRDCFGKTLTQLRSALDDKNIWLITRSSAAQVRKYKVFLLCGGCDKPHPVREFEDEDEAAEPDDALLKEKKEDAMQKP